MAKNNKYASINFNHIYEKSITTTNNSTQKNPSYSAVSAPNKHGRILVLTRPTPKPVSHPTKPNPIQQLSDRPSSESGSDSDSISLRPLGRTGTGGIGLSVTQKNDKDKNLVSQKTDKFVPPHLRPGFVPREERAGPEMGRFRENLRPKSGGYERIRRGGGSDTGFGNRPNSSG